MANNDAVFGLFTNDKASEVFKRLGITARTTAEQTQTMTEVVEKAGAKAITANNKEIASKSKLAIEQQKLTELRAKDNVASSTMMAQQERVANAERNVAVATESNTKAVASLSSAQIRATTGADALGASTHRLGDNSIIASSKLGHMFKMASQGAAIFAAYEIFKFGKESVKAAEDFQLSQAKLQVAIHNSGHAMTQYQKPIDALSTKFRHLGFTDTQTADGLAVLTTSLKDPAKALHLMGVAADLARYKNISLADSALVVAKGAEGQLRPLRALGIDLPVAAGGALKLMKAHEALAKAQANLAAIGGTVSVNNKQSVKEYNSVSNAQLHLTDLTRKYADPAKRTAEQTKVISAAQTTLNLVQTHGVTSNNRLQKAQEAVYKAQANVNAAASAGTKIQEGLAKAVNGQAAKAAETFKVKQDALNASLDHMKVKLGTDLLPVLQEFTDWADKSGVPFMEHMIDFSKNHGKEIVEVMGAIGTVFAAGKVMSGVDAIVSGLGKIKKAMIGLRVVAAETAAAEALAGGGAAAGTPAGALIVGAAGTAIAGDYIGKHLLPRILGGPNSPAAKKAAKDLQSAVNSARALPTGTGGPAPTFMSPAGSPRTIKPITTPSHAPTTIIHQHIAGSVITEKHLIDTVHNGIAQNMRNSGVSPKVIGKG